MGKLQQQSIIIMHLIVVMTVAKLSSTGQQVRALGVAKQTEASELFAHEVYLADLLEVVLPL